MPTFILENKSPFQILYNKIPDYSFLKVFGCVVFPHLRDYNKYKLDFQSDECIFLGYITAHKGYKCLHKSRKIFVMRHVVFNESDFPFKSDPSFKISKSYPNHDSRTLIHSPMVAGFESPKADKTLSVIQATDSPPELVHNTTVIDQASSQDEETNFESNTNSPTRKTNLESSTEIQATENTTQSLAIPEYVNQEADITISHHLVHLLIFNSQHIHNPLIQ